MATICFSSFVGFFLGGRGAMAVFFIFFGGMIFLLWLLDLSRYIPGLGCNQPRIMTGEYLGRCSPSGEGDRLPRNRLKPCDSKA